MALQMQRLGLNAIRTHLRTLSLSIRNENSPVTETSDHLPIIFITQYKKYPQKNDIQTTKANCYEEKSLGHSPLSRLEKGNVYSIRKESVSEMDIFTLVHKIKPESVLLHKQSLDDIVMNANFTQCQQYNRKKNKCETYEMLFQTSAIDKINVECLTSSVSWCSDLTKSSSKQPPEKTPGKPSEEQVENMREVLSEELPKFFKKIFNYSICDENIIFENNIWNKKTVGISKYSIQMMLIRILAGFKYVKVQMVVMKVTSHPEEGAVKVRWRIAGLPNTAAIKFWRYYPGRFKKHVKEDSQWTDGLSTFYVGSNGKIIKHRADKMIPDDEVRNVNPIVDEKIAPVGLMSKTEINNSSVV